ncbi:MAG: DNA mismatch repair endonuclease MutL [Planctomycetota bacterium]|jgi:DNA mismatch repair protein MutL
MAEIRILSEHIRNKISAGEVLERPASAVKELLENAIDADSDYVEIEIADGGQSYIRVSDNGSGISSDNIKTAVMRHATSKIYDIDDIYKINSMGFRGEALPSIAAVSRFEMSSRTAAENSGFSVEIEGGQITAEKPCSQAPGTVIKVRDLFYNTPARRKFMKSEASEASAVRKIVTRTAMAYPEVSFKYINNDKIVLNLQKRDNVLDRISDLTDARFSIEALPVNESIADKLHVSGFIGAPPVSAANSKSIYTFVNRRYISHQSLNLAIRRAFEGVLPARRYPIAYIYIALDPADIDINVHPTKSDIRFSDERKVNGLVYRAVAEAIRQKNKFISPPDNSCTKIDNKIDEDKVIIAEPAAVYSAPPGKVSNPEARFPKKTAADKVNISLFAGADADIPCESKIPINHTSRVQPLQESQKSRFNILCQTHDSFILVETESGVMFIDQHALHERIIYEELMKRKVDITVQKLLVPAVVELSDDEFGIIMENLNILQDMGFELEEFGSKTILIHAVPQLLKKTNAAELLKDCIFELSTGNTVMVDFREPFIRTIACKAAVKAGDRLPDQMILGLLDDMNEKNIPFTCPHGRPFAFEVSLSDISRRFERT